MSANAAVARQILLLLYFLMAIDAAFAAELQRFSDCVVPTELKRLRNRQILTDSAPFLWL